MFLSCETCQGKCSRPIMIWIFVFTGSWAPAVSSTAYKVGGCKWSAKVAGGPWGELETACLAGWQLWRPETWDHLWVHRAGLASALRLAVFTSPRRPLWFLILIWEWCILGPIQLLGFCLREYPLHYFSFENQKVQFTLWFQEDRDLDYNHWHLWCLKNSFFESVWSSWLQNSLYVKVRLL